MQGQGNENAVDVVLLYTVCYKSLFFSLSVQLIFTGEYTIAMNKSWHLGHFRCSECDISITGKQFVVREEKPICTDCFDQRFEDANEMLVLFTYFSVVQYLTLIVYTKTLSNVTMARDNWKITCFKFSPFRNFKTDSAQSSCNKCKNYLLKIYSQHINLLNTI